MQHLIVYSREGCHLCEDMLDAIAAFRVELNYEFRVYDVDEDESLLAQFNALVPVVYYQGREIMRYHFELATLRAALGSSE